MEECAIMALKNLFWRDIMKKRAHMHNHYYIKYHIQIKKVADYIAYSEK